MSDWNDGYVTDSEYLGLFFPELAPARLDFVALLNGVLPPDRPPGKFRLCELGCGRGLTALMLAAANPEAEVHAIDFMPAHIAGARRLATATGVNNVHFHEWSFVEANRQLLAPFDYIVTHGVFSWISPANREELIRFVRDNLLPGGLFYVSYNCLPGWSSAAPLQKLFAEMAAAQPGSSIDRAQAAMHFARQFGELKPLAFEHNPRMAGTLATLASKSPGYVAHEYLNGAWFPMYFTDVAKEAAQAKLDFIGTATLPENFPHLMISAELRPLISAQPTRPLRELMQDYALDTQFRRDVYCRGASRIDEVALHEVLQQQLVCLAQSPESTVYSAKAGATQLNFDHPAVREVVSKLAHQPCSLAELSQLPAFANRPVAVLLESIAMLLTARQVHLVERRTASAPHPINDYVLNRALIDDAVRVLASPLGVGISLDQIDMLLLAAQPMPTSVGDGVEYVIRKFAADGKQLSNHGQLLVGDALHAFLEPKVRGFYENRLSAYIAAQVIKQ